MKKLMLLICSLVLCSCATASTNLPPLPKGIKFMGAAAETTFFYIQDTNELLASVSLNEQKGIAPDVLDKACSHHQLCNMRVEIINYQDHKRYTIGTFTWTSDASVPYQDSMTNVTQTTEAAGIRQHIVYLPAAVSIGTIWY